MGQKAILMFDPDRRPEQVAFVTARTQILHQNGDQAWVVIDEGQAERMAAEGILVQFHPEADWLETPAIVFDPLLQEPHPPADLTSNGPYAIVQFVASPQESWVSQIQEMGSALVQSVPVNGMVMQLSPELLSAVRTLAFVRWVGWYHPAYALAFPLAGRSEPFGPLDLATLQATAPSETGDRPSLEIQFFDDRQPGEQQAAVEAAGGAVQTDTGYSLIVATTPARVRDLLRVPGVASVELHRPPELSNFRALAVTQVNHVAQFRNPGFLIALDGTGETVGIIDSGLDAGVVASVHPDLAGRVLLLNNMNPGGVSAADGQNDPSTPGGRNVHGTHVTGTVAGSGSQSNGKVRGVAPAANIVFQSVADLSVGGPPNGLNFSRFLSTNLGFALAHQRGARVHTNSWGADSLNNRYVDLVSGNIDRFCYLNPEDLVLFAAGNSERDIAPADGVLDQGTIGIQGLAKNVVTVGASENVTSEGTTQTYNAFLLPPAVVLPATGRFGLVPGLNPPKGDHPVSDNADDMAMFSDRGRVLLPAVGAAPAPAFNQRRVKPDIVAPGTNIVSTGPQIPAPNNVLPYPDGDNRRPSGAQAALYYVSSGTSMATPHVAGAAMLVRQYYRQVYGQLRRPQLLQQISQPVDRPAIAEHPDGTVMAWVRHDNDQNHIVAAVFDHMLVRQGALVQLAGNVGDHPAPMLAREFDNLYLLYRGSDRRLRLSCFNTQLQAVKMFGTDGVVTMANAAREEVERRPALYVHGNEVAVAWHQDGGDTLLLQRFSADKGAAVDASPIALGAASETSEHPYVLHTGEQYAVVWVRHENDRYQVQLRFVSNAGAAVGTGPNTVFEQQAQILTPHLAWEGTRDQFLVGWVDARSGAQRAIFATLVDKQGAPVGAPAKLVEVPEPSVVKNVLVGRHPASGYLTMWEDNLQRGESVFSPTQQPLRFDVNLVFLAPDGTVDGRIGGGRARISDASRDTYGFACLANWDGITPIWQSNDELNSDLIGVYALQVTLAGRFRSQVDPNTPLVDSGNYTRHELASHNDLQRTAVALAWAGGDVFLVRTMPDSDPLGAGARLDLMRLNADGLPDGAFGYEGARRVDTDFTYRGVEVHWADQRLVATAAQLTTTRLLLFDLARNGDPVATFGANGVQAIAEAPAPTINAQVAHQGVGAAFRVMAAWGKKGKQAGTPALHTIRYGVLDDHGAFTTAARDLVTGVAGTARHGWFHFAETETPPHSIAAWHSPVGAAGASTMAVFINRFEPSGRAQAVIPAPAAYVARPPLQLTTLPGDSQNAVIAPRPQAPAPTGTGITAGEIATWKQRQYGVAWQYRPNHNTAWGIYFSRLARDGTLVFPPPVPAPAPAHDLQVIFNAATDATDPQLVWHSDGYGLAWLQQPVAGGDHTLMFTVLDDQGTRVDLNFRVAPVKPADLYQVSANGGDVQDFALVWNGRTFRITWTEKRENKIYHMQTALAVPRKPGAPGYDRAYEHPSAALVRATLFNGATNIRRTALPNQGNNPNDGYGWGRLNLRQSLAPLPPVTFYARDDAAVAVGQTLRYRFRVGAGTRLLRVMLAWTDPPGVRLVNNLDLRVTAPDGKVYVGNSWQAAPNAQYSAPLPNPAPANPFETVHNAEQVVLAGALASGDYLVDVIGGAFTANAYQTHPGQAFALVFVGSGDEARFSGIPEPPDVPYY